MLQSATGGGRRLGMLDIGEEHVSRGQGHQADTEVLFFLALTFGLQDDPPAAVERAIGFVEAVAEKHGVPHPFQGTIATTDGESIWASRYYSEGKSRSLFYTTDIPTLRNSNRSGSSSRNSPRMRD